MIKYIVSILLKVYLVGIIFNILITSPIMIKNGVIFGWSKKQTTVSIIYFMSSWGGFFITIIKNKLWRYF